MSYSQILYPQLRELLDQGAQLVEVLPRAEHDELHLPGALSIPLKTLDADTAAELERAKAVVVYCWDGL
jgi:rhodanese-related sulfurtransferase